jgi:endonuclease YncB( thermonuclease family)
VIHKTPALLMIFQTKQRLRREPSKPFRFGVLLPFPLHPILASGAELAGRVVRVVDGDTLVILDASNTP